LGSGRKRGDRKDNDGKEDRQEVRKSWHRFKLRRKDTIRKFMQHAKAE
jgi:hypothetical protein